MIAGEIIWSEFHITNFQTVDRTNDGELTHVRTEQASYTSAHRTTALALATNCLSRDVLIIIRVWFALAHSRSINGRSIDLFIDKGNECIANGVIVPQLPVWLAFHVREQLCGQLNWIIGFWFERAASVIRVIIHRIHALAFIRIKPFHRHSLGFYSFIVGWFI